MIINEEKCVMCGKCIPYCPLKCITKGENSMVIDFDECVECGTCLRNANCPKDAIEEQAIEMPRWVRKAFSDPYAVHKNTKGQHGGRGTEEIKTNDVTGVIHDLETVGVSIEMGRPGLGARFKEVQEITTAVAPFGVNFDEGNPVTLYMEDVSKGLFDPTILDEKVLSCIVEFTVTADKLLDVLNAVKDATTRIHTVISVCVLCCVDENDETIVEREIVANGYNIRRASSKTNLGLGRPLYEDRIKGGN